MEEEQEDHADRETRNLKKSNDGFRELVHRPVNWLRMLVRELHWTFILGVVIVYGVSQGLGVGLSRVSTQYYMKDEQKLQPSEAQVYFGLIQIPWIVKPLWGLLTDTVPVLGFRRRPYFVFAGSLLVVSMIWLSLHKHLLLIMASISLMAGSAGIAIADVTIDACVTQNSISHPSLAGDMQTLCGLSSSIGALIGFSVSGFFVHLLGPRGVYGLLSIPGGLVIMVGMMMKETRIHNFDYRRVNEKFLDASKAMGAALKLRDVWRPCLYMFLSLALSLNVHGGMFYWYTDAETGPSFSQEAVGSIFSVGAAGSLLGVLLYQNVFKNHPFRKVLFWAQLLYGASGLLDLVFVLRFNLEIGIPDYLFVVIDECVSLMIGRIKWMPLLVLSSKLCPSGVEGTFFALLMSIDHVGILSSSWAGGLLLKMLNVTRTQFDNLWLAIVIRSILRLTPIGLLFLVPKGDPNSAILPTDMQRMRKGDAVLDSENIEMASLVNST